MLTPNQLAALLKGIPAQDVAAEADVSTRTVYRLRHLRTVPSIETAAKVVAAIERIKARTAKPKRREKVAA